MKMNAGRNESFKPDDEKEKDELCFWEEVQTDENTKKPVKRPVYIHRDLQSVREKMVQHSALVGFGTFRILKV